jgi:putative ABC transport system permease protein
MFRDFAQDVSFALRALARRPGYAGTAIATLALGIGATTAVFSVVNGVLLRPLPFPKPDAIVRLQEMHADGARPNLTGADFAELQARGRSLAFLAVLRTSPLNLSGLGPAEPVTAARVSAEFFDVLGVRPLAGRFFAAHEFAEGSDRVVVLAEPLWRRLQGGDPAVLGRVVRLDGEDHRVVGILPAGQGFPAGVELWLPLNAQRQIPGNRHSHLFLGLGRVRHGLGLAQVQAELDTLSSTRLERSDDVEGRATWQATRLHESLTAPVRPALAAVFAAVGLLLLVSCVNVANLLLARAAEREREMAVRTALGAGGFRLARQLLTESVLLGLMGALPALGLAWAATRALPALLPADLPRLEAVGWDASLFAFALAAGVATALVFGLWPVREALRTNLRDALARGGGGAVGPNRVRGAFVVAEVALLVVLLSSAGLLLRTFSALRAVPLGFAPEGILTFYVSPGGPRYATADEIAHFADTVAENLRALPGASAVAVASALPTTPLPSTDFALEGRDPEAEDQRRSADVLAVSPEYLGLLHIPLLAGRGIEERDGTGATPVVLLSRAAAEAFWPGESPLGRTLTLLHWDEPLTAEVVGVVADVRQRGPDAPVEPAVYFSHRQFADRVLGWYFQVRSAGAGAALAAAARERVQAIDADQPLTAVRPLDALLASALGSRRFNAALVAAFAALALALVLVGLEGVVARFVAERRRDIGVRLALGASARDLQRHVLGHGLRLSLLGLALGLPAAIASGRALRGLLVGVAPADPATLVLVAALVASLTLLAAWRPARKATSVDPVSALRAE